MKRVLLLLTLLSLTTFVSGQTWAPTGAKWTFGVGYAFGPQVEYREWISTGDTLVDGHVCKLIKRNGGYVSGDITNELITYEESNKVYWYNINQFTVLYDFNKNSGDTWTIMTDTCGLLITVDSTSIDTINGFPLKALYVSSDDWAFNGKILEHIGHIGQPNPNIIYHCTGAIEDYNYYIGLRCYEDNEFGFFSLGIAPSCDYIISGIDELKNPFGLLIFPNPATNQLIIKTNLKREFHFNIYNSLGQIVKNGIGQSGTMTIYLGNLREGHYSIELNADNITQRQCFIVGK